MRHTIFRNPGLKIASLAIAFLVWLAILNVSNPVIPKTFTGVPVTITNGTYVESQDLSYRIEDGYDTVNVMVRGNRSVVDRLTSANVSVSADLTQIVDMTSDPVMVPVTVSVPGITQENITPSPRNIRIVLESMESKDFVLNATAGSTTPGRGYEVGKMTVNPDRITIRGPESLVEKIDKVQAEVDVTDLTEDTALSPTLHVYDKNGDVLTDTQMNYLTFSVSENAIRVNVRLYEVVTDVVLTAEAYGEPAEGYEVGDITVTPSTISLAGSEEALAALAQNGNRIVIDEASKAVDVTGASYDVDIPVNLPDYLTDGLRLADGLSDTVVVTVKILRYNTKSIELATKDIEKKNLPDGFSAVFTDSQIDIRIQGSAAALSDVDADDIGAVVDLSGVRTGAVTLPVEITLPAGCTLEEEVEAHLTISRTVTQRAESTAENNEAAQNTAAAVN